MKQSRAMSSARRLAKLYGYATSARLAFEYAHHVLFHRRHASSPWTEPVPAASDASLRYSPTSLDRNRFDGFRDSYRIASGISSQPSARNCDGGSRVLVARKSLIFLPQQGNSKI